MHERQPPHRTDSARPDEMDAWKEFRARHEIPDYQPGDNELAYLEALAHALDVHVYNSPEALRKAFDIGLIRGRIEGVALAQKIISPQTKE